MVTNCLFLGNKKAGPIKSRPGRSDLFQGSNRCKYTTIFQIRNKNREKNLKNQQDSKFSIILLKIRQNILYFSLDMMCFIL